MNVDRLNAHPAVRRRDSQEGCALGAHLAIARAGLGIAQMPAFMFQHAGPGELKAILGAWQPAPLPMHVLYPPNRHLSAKVRVFVDWIAELFAGRGVGRRNRLASPDS